MTQSEHAARAVRFRELNLAGRLLLPNAWDAASARVFEAAGFAAIGTTSGGIANARGFPDGEIIGRDAMVREIAAIVNAVDVPVTADIESGYGDSPAAVSETVNAVLDLGIVGVNLEDNAQGRGAAPLYSIDEQAARIRAARAAADLRGIQLVINARTDPFLLGLGGGVEARVAMTIERGLMALPGAPPAGVLFEAGACRVSLGNCAMLATLGLLRKISREVLGAGTWTSIEDPFYGFKEASVLFAPR